MKKVLSILVVFLALSNSSRAQNITGTWRGDLGNDEYFEINMVQIGKKICGYTLDYNYSNERSYCKQNFNSSYNEDSRTWFTYGTDFISQGGGHVLMDMKFRIMLKNGKLYLYGVCRAQSAFADIGGEESVTAMRVSTKPTMLTEGMKNCIEEAKKLKAQQKAPAPVVKKKAEPVKPKAVVPIKPNIVKPPVVEKIKDTIPKIAAPVIIPKPIKEQLPVSTAGRTNKETSHIIIHQRKLKLSVYDNGEVDGDTLSIYYNGRLIMSHKRLSQIPIVIDLDLDPNTNLHSFVLFAENLGSVPPNTALVIFNDAKGKRYELFTRSTLKENAQLVFEYQPE